jgi:hypothetical protein
MEDEIFGDVEEYSAMCHGWTIFLDEKMDELSNEHWQQIKLHIPPFTTNFFDLYMKLHLLYLYYLVESFLPLPCLHIYSTLIALYAIDSCGHSTIMCLFNST